MDTSPVDWERLTRYLSGQCTPDEVRAFERWMAEDPERRALVEDVRTGWRAGTPEMDASVNLAAGWREVRGAMETAPTSVASPRVGNKFASGWGPAVVGIVGALVVAACAVFLLYRPDVQPMREFVTPLGSRATITLRDGTRLTLGPGTHLRIPKEFGVHTRSVELTGEAVFSVVHDASHPFVVNAQGAVITDVGTEFDVRDYSGDSDVRVAVAQGAVALGLRSEMASGSISGNDMLHPGDMATITATGISVVRGASLAPYFAWTQGHLTFDATPLRDVVRALGRTFNLDIQVADSALGNQRVTASFTDQPVNAILEDIVALVGARYDRTGRAVVIKRNVVSTRRNQPRPQLLTSHQ